MRKQITYYCLAVLVLNASVAFEHAVAEKGSKEWNFVSIPDFLNYDTVYPEPNWEDALSYTHHSKNVV
jgi:hypothetical protein